MKHTPEGSTAYENNVCPRCGSDHVCNKTAVRCTSCQSPLPRPQLRRTLWRCDGCNVWMSDSRKACTSCDSRRNDLCEVRVDERLTRGFGTSYRRMRWDAPANALTTNSGVISSDVKCHPTQHRVLSVREVLRASTVDGPFPWRCAWKPMEREPHRLIRHVLGESIPPLFLYTLLSHIVHTSIV